MLRSRKQAGDTNHQQTHDNGLFCVVAQHVHQHRHCENGATAAQQPQRDTNQDREGQAKQQHYAAMPCAANARMLAGTSQLAPRL